MARGRAAPQPRSRCGPALLALERASGRRRFRTRDRAGRLRALERLRRARCRSLPQLAEALRSAALMSYHGDARVMAALGYDAAARVAEVRARRARETGVEGPDPARDATTGPPGAAPPGAGRQRAAPQSGAAPRTLRADVCVVGAGAGGAVVAKELAEGGARVVVLEEGGEHPAATMTGRPRDMLARLYRDGGQIATVGRPPIVLPLGRGLGGTTLVNSGTCFRTPDRVLAAWRAEYGLDALTPAALAPVLRPRRGDAGRRGGAGRAGRRERRADPPRRRAARLVGRPPAPQRARLPGQRRLRVRLPHGRQAARGRRLPRARRAPPARRVVHRRARRRVVVMRGRRAVAVEARTPDGARLTVVADAIVVAAGTIHTPLLLGASGLGGGSGRLGRNLSLHPATAVWGLFDEEVDMVRGVPQSYCVDEFAAAGIMLEGIAGPPDYLAMSAPFTGDRHRELMLRYRHVGQCGLMISDRSRGRVRGRPGAPLIRYDLCREDVATIHHGLVRLAELLAAAGARSPDPPARRACPSCPDADPAAAARAATSRRRDLKLMAFHPLGTARAHADPAAAASSTATCACTAPRTSTSPTAAPSRARSA